MAKRTPGVVAEEDTVVTIVLNERARAGDGRRSRHALLSLLASPPTREATPYCLSDSPSSFGQQTDEPFFTEASGCFETDPSILTPPAPVAVLPCTPAASFDHQPI